MPLSVKFGTLHDTCSLWGESYVQSKQVHKVGQQPSDASYYLSSLSQKSSSTVIFSLHENFKVNCITS